MNQHDPKELPPLPNELPDKGKPPKTDAGKDLPLRVRRGDIYIANLGPVVGSEQGGLRPVLVVQNDVGNKHSPTVIIVPITTKTNKPKLPTHVEIKLHNRVYNQDSLALGEQLRTLDKSRLTRKVGRASGDEMRQMNRALKVSLELH